MLDFSIENVLIALRSYVDGNVKLKIIYIHIIDTKIKKMVASCRSLILEILTSIKQFTFE